MKPVLIRATLRPQHQFTGMRMLFLRKSIVFHHGNFELERLSRQLAALLIFRVLMPRDCVSLALCPRAPPERASSGGGGGQGRSAVDK